MSDASAIERQFWLAEQIAPGANANLGVGRVRIEGPVDLDALSAGLRAVRRRHPVLRTAFVLAGMTVLRKPLDEPATAVLRLPAGTDFATATRLLTRDRFDITTGQVCRFGVAIDETGADVWLAAHHIAIDGLSHELFAADLARALGGAELAVQDRAASVEPTGARRAELIAHWRDALAGVPDLPAGGSEMTQRELLGAGVAEAQAEIVAPRLRNSAQARAVSPFALLFVAYGRALAELSGGDDFCVGTPITVRTPAQEQEMGCAINTLPIRLRGLAAGDAVERTWSTLIDAMVNSDLPGEEIIKAARPGVSRRIPLYQALLAYQSWQRVQHPAGAAQLWTVPVRPVAAQAEVQLQICERGDKLDLVAQAPVGGFWAVRLDSLISVLHRHLREVS